MNKTTSRKEIRKRQDRLEVMHAAQHAFVRFGVAAVKVADITAAAGVAYGTFYNHFESKEILATELARRVMDERDLALQDRVNRAGPKPAQKMAALLESAVQEARLNPVWRWLFTDPAVSMIEVASGQLADRIAKSLIAAEHKTDPQYGACLYRFMQAGVTEMVRGISDGSLGERADQYTLEFALKMFGANAASARRIAEAVWQDTREGRYQSYIHAGTHCLECGFNLTQPPSAV